MSLKNKIIKFVQKQPEKKASLNDIAQKFCPAYQRHTVRGRLSEIVKNRELFRTEENGNIIFGVI